MKKTLLKIVMLVALLCSGALTSYAGWKEVKSWDFTALATEYGDGYHVSYEGSVTLNKIGCDKGTGIFEDLAFQGGSNWWLRTNKAPFGLYQGNGGGRIMAILGLTAGNKVTIKTDIYSNDEALSGEGNATLSSHEKVDNVNIYEYSVTADGDFYVSVTRYFKVVSILVENFEQEAGEVMADYNLKFVNAQDVEIKESVKREGLVGTDVVINATDKDPIMFENKKYIYESDDAEGMTIAETGTVVTLKFREAATYTYKVITSNPEKELANGTDFEGNTVTVPYPAYMLKADSVLSARATVNSQYNATIENLNQDTTLTLDYTNSEYTNVVFYAEAEDIMNVSTGSNAATRCSMGKGGYASQDTVIAPLAAGKYTLTVSTRGGNNRDWGFNFVIGNDTVYTTPVLMGYNQTGTSEEFVVSKDANLVMLKAGSNNDMVDFLFITKTGEYVAPIIEAASVTLNEHAVELGIGETLQLEAVVAPEDVTDATLTWSTTDEAVATVSEAGLVTAVAVGEAKVVVVCGEVADTCVVTVTKLAQTITWDQEFLGVEVGDTITLAATASSELAVTYAITYGENVAKLEGDKLIIEGAGTVKVTATQEGNETYLAAEPVEQTITALDGIQAIEAGEADAIYYNLQGTRVDNPAAGSVYIRVQGAKATKVVK